jgi:hypothetical protein
MASGGWPDRFAAVCRWFRKKKHLKIVSYTENMKNTPIYVYVITAFVG